MLHSRRSARYHIECNLCEEKNAFFAVTVLWKVRVVCSTSRVCHISVNFWLDYYFIHNPSGDAVCGRCVRVCMYDLWRVKRATEKKYIQINSEKFRSRIEIVIYHASCVCGVRGNQCINLAKLHLFYFGSSHRSVFVECVCEWVCECCCLAATRRIHRSHCVRCSYMTFICNELTSVCQRDIPAKSTNVKKQIKEMEKWKKRKTHTHKSVDSKWEREREHDKADKKIIIIRFLCIFGAKYSGSYFLFDINFAPSTEKCR